MHHSIRHHQTESPDGEEPVKAVNPVQIVLRALRGRWKFAIPLAILLAAAGALGGYHSKHPIYVSGGTIQVFPNKQNILYSDNDDSRLRLFDAFVAAELAYLTSMPVMERAIQLPMMQDLEWPTGVVGAGTLKKTLAVDKKGGLITVTAADENPVVAAVLLNSVLEAYATLHDEQLRQNDVVREKELTEREHLLIKRLNDFDEKVLKVGREYGTGSIGMAHTRKISQAEEVDQRISDLELTIATKEAADAANNVDIGDAEIKRLLVLDHAMADMLFERSKIAADLAVLKTQHALEHHAVRETKARIEVIDAAIEDRRSQLATLGTSGTLTSSGSGGKAETVDDLKSLRGRFITRRDDLQREARDLNERLVQLEFLRKERDESRILLDETRRALEQVRVESRHSLPGTVEVKSRGNVSATPVTDKRMAFAGAGGVFGSLAGVALTVLYGLVFRRYRYSDELSSSVPVLGALPASSSEFPEVEVHFLRAIQHLRVELQLLSGATPGGQILAVTGAGRGSGCTTVAIALAKAFSEATMKTILVDADFNNPQITERLEAIHSPGVREALLEGKLTAPLKEAAVGELRTLPIGARQQLSDAHVSHRPLAMLLHQLRSLCDLVILDLGPLPERLTARLGVALADQVLCVVPAGELPSFVEPSLKDLNRLAPYRAWTVFNGALSSDPLLVDDFRRTLAESTHGTLTA